MCTRKAFFASKFVFPRRRTHFWVPFRAKKKGWASVAAFNFAMPPFFLPFTPCQHRLKQPGVIHHRLFSHSFNAEKFFFTQYFSQNRYYGLRKISTPNANKAKSKQQQQQQQQQQHAEDSPSMSSRHPSVSAPRPIITVTEFTPGHTPEKASFENFYRTSKMYCKHTFAAYKRQMY